MRIESSVTSVSWIPSEAIGGMLKAPFELGVTHYDEPPPEAIDDLEALREADRFRFANDLRAFVEVGRGEITGYGYAGRGLMGSTTVRLGPGKVTFAAVALPDIRQEPQVGDGWVRFVQTTGGRAGIPSPRRVRRAPFVQISPPLVWTTLALTVHADGSSSFDVLGASSFPRHWVYDHSGKLMAKVGLTNFKDWYRKAFGKYSPWGEQDSPALVTEVETAMERELSTRIMRGGAKPEIRKVKKGKALVEQGQTGDELYLLLDGVVSVVVDGSPVAEIGPGAILGERAILEGGRRTSTLLAVTPIRVAAARGDQLDRDLLAEVARGHKREG